MSEELKKERMEITIGNTKNPLFHLVSTVGKFNDVLNFAMFPPRPPITVSRRVATTLPEPINIKEIRNKYRLAKRKVENERDLKLLELTLEEEMEIARARTETHP